MAIRISDKPPHTRWASKAARLGDSNQYIRQAAIEALGNRPNLPNEVLNTMYARLEDSNHFIREAARIALGIQSDLSYTFEEDYSQNISRAAIDALGIQSNLPDEVLNDVAVKLEIRTESYLVDDVLRRHGRFPHDVLNVSLSIPLYRNLLKQSFKWPLCWYHQNDVSFFVMPHEIIKKIGDQRASVEMANRLGPAVVSLQN